MSKQYICPAHKECDRKCSDWRGNSHKEPHIHRDECDITDNCPACVEVEPQQEAHICDGCIDMKCSMRYAPMSVLTKCGDKITQPSQVQEKQCPEQRALTHEERVELSNQAFDKFKPTPTLREQMPLIGNPFVAVQRDGLADIWQSAIRAERDADMAWYKAEWNKRLEEIAEYIKSGKWIGTGEEGDDVCSLLARYILTQREGVREQ